MLYRFFLLFACTLLQATAAAPDAGGFTPLPPKQPSEAVATFDLDANFRVELVAAEPLIADPVALSFDENGVLYVVEMRDYSERRDERLGRVTRLEDVDHDGRMDRATRFAEDLPWPTGIIAYDGGVFVVAAPDLWFFKDTDGDGVADVRKIVFTGFGELALDRPGNRGYNVQQLPNSLRWGPDQRIHVAEGGNGSRVRRPEQPAGEALVLRGQDLSFDPRTFDLRAVNGGGQNGMAFDDWGRKFVSSNSRHLMQVAYLDSPALNGALLLPSPTQDIAVDGPAAPVFRRSPDEAWRVARTRWRVAGLVPGPIEGGGTPSGYFTGATGVQIYRGDLFSAEFRGSAWIADCGSNLIHRKRLRQDGVLMQGSRFDGDGGREVLASTDNWFRPVQFENGPDGALYVLDLYREIIEHPWSLPPGIKEHLDLNRGNDRGRIWRIVPVDGKPRRRVTLGELTSAQLVETLGHPNGWHRDAAARLLSQRQEASALPLLAAALRSDNRHQRLGALSVLASQRQIDESALIGALADPEAMVRWRALELARKGLSAERWLRPNLTDRMKQLAADPAPEVRFTVALLLGDLPLPSDLAFEVWATLAPAAGNDPFQQRAIARFMTPHAPSAVERLIVQAGELPATALALDLIRVAASQASAEQVARWLMTAATSGDPVRSRRMALIAAGVGSVPAVTAKVQLSRALKEQLADALSELFAGPTPESRGEWMNPAFALLAPEQVERAMLPLLHPEAAGTDRDRAVALLLGLKNDQVFRQLLERWPVLPAASRQRLLAEAQNNRPQLAAVLDHATADESFRAQLNPTLINAARQHQDATLRSRALALFGEAADATLAQRELAFAEALTLPGNAASGRVIYQNRCASCHRAHDEGFALGPDLLTVAGAGRAALLSHIIDPNREVAPRFEAWTVRREDGEEVSGILLRQDDNGVVVRAASDVETAVPADQVAAAASTGRSLMPPGLDDGLSAAEMADLLRFIESLAGR